MLSSDQRRSSGGRTRNQKLSISSQEIAHAVAAASAQQNSLKFVVASTGLLILVVQIGAGNAAAFEEQISDITADCALGLEDYPAAIALIAASFARIRTIPSAHYHLGFAYGMTGRSWQERSEYLKAVRLGLREWDLFLDLGLSYFEQRDYQNAIHAFETSVTLGSHHPEAHVNLAMAYFGDGI
jgi:tetratricopeptide (TPR) repeat protein